jgi:tetratricopeptide (TPR) repeat protein
MPKTPLRLISCWSTLLLSFSLTALFPVTEAECAAPEGKTTAVEHADKAFLKMNYIKADSLYSSELRRNPGNAETYWKLSRLQVSLGESAEHSTGDERLRYYRKAMEYAKTCITLDSTISKGHSWYAASLAIMADKIGTKEKLTRAKEVKRELDTALRLNPNDETALSILGSYYREAASIGWFKRMIGNAFIGEVPKGNYDLAEKAFRKAISIDPRIIRNYHELALIQIEKGQRDEAVRLMKTALDKPIIMGSDRKRIEEMRTLLKKLSND